ncbi:MAG: MlaC/ttg2D family ABC transporter substrate-binding protein [Parashewanella sp.]
MLKFIRYILLPIAMLLNINVALADQIDTSNPYTMVQQVAKKTFARFDNDQAKINADPNYLKLIVEQELLPYVDYKYASYKVLGRNLAKSSKSQRDNFVIAFRDYMISTYASAFTAYTHQKISFSPAKNIGKDRIVTVNVQVLEEGRPPIKIAFKVRRQKNNSWKVIDLVAEGISMLQSKQSEIGSLIQKDGIDSVIKQLNEHAKADVKPLAGTK